MNAKNDTTKKKIENGKNDISVEQCCETSSRELASNIHQTYPHRQIAMARIKTPMSATFSKCIAY